MDVEPLHVDPLHVDPLDGGPGGVRPGGGLRSQRERLVAGAAAVAVIGVGVGLAFLVPEARSAASPLGPGPAATASPAPARSTGQPQSAGQPHRGALRLVAAPSPGPVGPEGVPVPRARALARRGRVQPGQRVDGVACPAREQVSYHVHAHLTIFVDGAARRVPAGIGIAAPAAVETAEGPWVEGGACFSWLHTHAPDGIVHVESPLRLTFTLGQFFDLWHQPLAPDRAGPARGRVTAFYDGRRWTANPRAIPLTAHAQIQLDVGTPVVAPEHITFPSGL